MSGMKKIDFLIIGAMKCATTSLHACLGSHPDIYMVDTAETGYFLEPNNDRSIKGLTNNEIRKYMDNESLIRQMASGYTGQLVFGERSTDYSKFPYRKVSIGRMTEMNPGMRFIYIVRNPLDRIVSNYFHFLRHRPAETNPDFNRELQAHGLYVKLSCYFYQLGHYLKKFPKENFRVILFEDFMVNRSEVLRGVYEFLGVENRHAVPDPGRHNVNPIKNMIATPRFDKRAYNQVVDKIKPDMDKLGSFMGKYLYWAWDISRDKLLG